MMCIKKYGLPGEDLRQSLIYMLEGEVEINGEGGINQTFDSTTDRAKTPLFRVNSPGLYGVVRRHTQC